MFVNNHAPPLLPLPQPLLFGTLLNRDQVLDDIMEQGFVLELPWGFDPAPQSEPTITVSKEEDSGVNVT